MSTYRVADGHDVALLSLGTLALQPSTGYGLICAGT
jgi:hypothetical protein